MAARKTFRDGLDGGAAGEMDWEAFRAVSQELNRSLADADFDRKLPLEEALRKLGEAING